MENNQLSLDELRDLCGNQLWIDSFEPHHTFTFKYPDIDLVPHDGHMILLPVQNARNRYEPLPLVRNAAVTAHTDRETANELSIFTRTKASKVLGPNEKSGTTENIPVDDFCLLSLHMQLVEQYFGRTTLIAVTYKFDGPPLKDRVFVNIYRKTTYFLENQQRRECGSYMILLEDLLRVVYKPAWLETLKRLMLRADDISYRHVRYMLEANDIAEERTSQSTDSFLPPRLEDFSRNLDQKSLEQKLSTLMIADLEDLYDADAEYTSCTVCQETINPGAVILRCSHQICRECLEEWCKSSGVEVSCPLCREKIFPDEQERRAISFGLDTSTGAYVYDPRFNQWENFERSCADLDCELAENDNEERKLDAEKFLRGWDYIIEGALLEPPSSTPFHLQPARYPELQIAAQEVKDRVTALHGRMLSPALLFGGLEHNVSEAFDEEMEETEVDAYTADQDLLLRPGFREFLARTLNRALRFWVVRP